MTEPFFYQIPVWTATGDNAPDHAPNHPPNPVVSIIPCLHGSVEFAQYAIECLKAIQPDVLVIEFPKILEQEFIRGIKRLPLISVTGYRPMALAEEEKPIYYLFEPYEPIVAASLTALNMGIEIKCGDLLFYDQPARFNHAPDTYTIAQIGVQKYLELYEQHTTPSDYVELPRQQMMTAVVQDQVKKNKKVTLLCEQSLIPSIIELMKHPIPIPFAPKIKSEQIVFAHLDEESCSEVMQDIPSNQYEFIQRVEQDDSETFDRWKAQEDLLKQAKDLYEEKYHTQVSRMQIRNFRQFATQYAKEMDAILLNFYHLLVAVKATTEDALANYVYEIGSKYPNPNLSALLPTIALSSEDLGELSNRIRFRPRIPKRRVTPFGIKKRPKIRPAKVESDHDYWEGSHLKEDFVLNGYTDFLCQKTKGLLSQRHDHVEPFTTSLMDGIDIRETLLHSKEKRIYIRNRRFVKGAVSSVVIIFDEALQESWDKYPFKRTWGRETRTDVERAFYATDPEDNEIGPDIYQSEYGGLLASYNWPGLWDIWNDPYFSLAESPAELLLMAAIEYSNEKLVVYIAKDPPLRQYKNWASRLGHQLIYIPYHDLSPVMIKKIRTFHVLRAKQARDYVDDFAW